MLLVYRAAEKGEKPIRDSGRLHCLGHRWTTVTDKSLLQVFGHRYADSKAKVGTHKWDFAGSEATLWSSSHHFLSARAVSSMASLGSLGGGIFRSVGSTPQTSLAYSVMVLSLENFPVAAMFLITILVHSFGFWWTWSISKSSKNTLLLPFHFVPKTFLCWLLF